MDTLFFCLSLGGATLILIICGVRLMRKFPRIKPTQTLQEEDPNLYAVAMRAWETGRPVVGSVDDDGNLTMQEIREEWPGSEIERERIQRQEVCSDKSHWRN